MTTTDPTTPVRTAEDIHVYVRPLYGVALGMWIDRRVREGHPRLSVEQRADIFRQNIRYAQQTYIAALDEAFDHGRSLGLSGQDIAEHAQDYTRSQRRRLADLLLMLEQ